MTDVVNQYMEHRPLMFSIAYRMTGSVSDAEDIVQDAYLRLARAGRDGTVIANHRAFLTTVTTRLAIDQMTSARARREAYVGSWLPEPLLVDTDPGPQERAELSDTLSFAFLVMLESLSPVERAVFLLREVFEYDYAQIAEMTGKSEQNCRQILARARRHVGDGPKYPASRAEGERVAREFIDAVQRGDIDALLDLLAPDVVAVGDGGGRGAAARLPLHGKEPVGEFLATALRRGGGAASGQFAWVNGQPGAVGWDAAGRLAAVVALEITDGKISAIRTVANPDKLSHLTLSKDA
jgi:RNA polymerase sigma-70 factor (ECF subfamily)